MLRKQSYDKKFFVLVAQLQLYLLIVKMWFVT